MKRKPKGRPEPELIVLDKASERIAAIEACVDASETRVSQAISMLTQSIQRIESELSSIRAGEHKSYDRELLLDLIEVIVGVRKNP